MFFPPLGGNGTGPAEWSREEKQLPLPGRKHICASRRFLKFVPAKLKATRSTTTTAAAAPALINEETYLLKMSLIPKRRCPDPMNDSMEKRIKRISIEGNIGQCRSSCGESKVHITS